jgi:hypothetical protein
VQAEGSQIQGQPGLHSELETSIGDIVRKGKTEKGRREGRREEGKQKGGKRRRRGEGRESRKNERERGGRKEGNLLRVENGLEEDRVKQVRVYVILFLRFEAVHKILKQRGK